MCLFFTAKYFHRHSFHEQGCTATYWTCALKNFEEMDGAFLHQHKLKYTQKMAIHSASSSA